MQDRPTFAELLVAVREFLETEIGPKQADHRARFRTLVAINALTILERELELEPAVIGDEAQRLMRLLGTDAAVPADPEELRARVVELNAELAARIRRGDVPPGTREHLRHVAAAKLQVASPKYLQRQDR
jgi:hypothetical protein